MNKTGLILIGLCSSLLGIPVIDFPASAQAVSPPLPEVANEPVASVNPMKGTVNIKLNNSTNTLISYEVIGHTGMRQLRGGEAVMLQDIPVPATVTMIREDNGLLQIIPVSSQSALLIVTLEEKTNLDSNQGVLRIQRNGKVFLN